jgi:hypothetical protein
MLGDRVRISCSWSAFCAAGWVNSVGGSFLLNGGFGAIVGLGFDTSSSVAVAEVAWPWQESKMLEDSSRVVSTTAFDTVSDKPCTVTTSREILDSNSIRLRRRRLFSSRKALFVSSSGLPVALTSSSSCLRRSACLRRNVCCDKRFRSLLVVN